MNNFIYLILAIIAEVIATSMLKKLADAMEAWSWNFDNVSLLGMVIFFYCLAFYGLALAVKEIPIGIAYAIWAGLGVSLVTLIGWLVFHQKLAYTDIIGIGLIVAGVIIIQLNNQQV